MIHFKKPTYTMLESIAADMRDEDAAEVWASHHYTPLESLVKGMAVTDFSLVVMYDEVPLVVIGLVKRDLLSGTGLIWMLGSNAALKHKREFFTLTGPIMDEMLTICPRLCNMVHSKNTKSIQWLKWLGFNIEEPVPYGAEQEPFHPFYLER